MALDEKGKVEQNHFEEGENPLGFFDASEEEGWDEALEDEALREKLREHKVKSMKGHRRAGIEGEKKNRGAYRRR